MVQWMKTRLAVIVIGLVAVLAAMGAGGVAAAQAHVGSTPGVEDHKIAGHIQSVNWTQRTFVLLPDGKKGPVTISFNSKTNIEGGRSTLKGGVHVRVEVLNQRNGSLYATEVKPFIRQGSDAGIAGHEHDRGDHDVNDDHGRDG